MPFLDDLTKPKKRDHLIKFLGIDEKTFDGVLAFEPSTRAFDGLEPTLKEFSLQYFYRHEIPKNNRRGYRIVWEPSSIIKNDYKRLARILSNFFTHKLVNFPHPRTFGFIGGRNIRENAQDHCGHLHLISIDLKDFFPSIETSRIAAFLSSLGVEPTVSDLLSRFATIGGALPLGLPTSPTISNAICLPLDLDLEALARRFDATFSRYADDISFSSNNTLPPQEEIAAYVQRHGFEIAKSKTRISRLGQAHYVTGLSVSDPAQPHVSKRKKRRLRQELYYAAKYGLQDHFQHLGINDLHLIQSEINRLDGLVKFTSFHEPRIAAGLKLKWTRILDSDGRRPSFAPKNQHKMPFYIYVDETEYVREDGSRLLALAMAVSQHQQQIDQSTQTLLDDFLADPLADGNQKAIAKRGMHFTDATQDMKGEFVKCMSSMPFEGFVAMARLRDMADYEATYVRLLNAMIRRRLMAAESQFAYLVFEKNDKVNQNAVRQVVQNAYISLRTSNNRRPKAYDITFAGKPNPGISVPDFLLGVLGKYLQCPPEKEGRPPARDRLLFERIRDKYRLILDVDSGIEYSRRRRIEPWHPNSSN